MNAIPRPRGALHPRMFACLLLVAVAIAGCGRNNLVAPDPPLARSAQALHRDRFKGQPIHLEGRVPSGAIWEIDKPANWNRALVVYAHGYTNPGDPVALPHNEAIRDSLVARGYAVVASSFSSNGFAVREGVRESDALREIFEERVGEPRRTYLFGQSLGGLIGLLLSQRESEHYDGSFLVCGIVGTSVEEIQYIGDIRVLFEAVYGPILPGDLEHSPVITDVNKQIVGPVVAAVTQNPQGLGIIQLLARHPLAGATSQELVTSLVTALGFSVQGGGDLFARTQSQSFFDNATWTYSSTALPPALVADINARVARYTRSPEAEQFLRRFGEPSPRLRIPLLSLHSTRDPVVPAWHEDRLAQVVTSPLLIQRRVDRYGHCPFSAGELMVHFNDLVNFANDVKHDDDHDGGTELAVQTAGRKESPMKTLSFRATLLSMVLAALVLGSPARADFVTKWGPVVPYALAVDASGNVYAPEGAHIKKYDGNGNLLMQWGSLGTGDGQFTVVSGIAVDGSGNAYVADGIDNVQKFDANGAFLLKWGSSGFGDGQFSGPTGVALDAAGNVYVSDFGNADFLGRVQKFDRNGTFLMKWFTTAHNGSVAIDANGNVFVGGASDANRVFKFDANGNGLTSWGQTGCGDGQFNRITDIAADANGDVYVTDGQNHRVQKFTNDGGFITKWGGLGTADGQFIHPEGVAVDANFNVFVGDGGNSRIQKFGSGVGVGGGECPRDPPPPPPPPPTPAEQVATISGSVQGLVAQGVLLPAQGNSLLTKLDAALGLIGHDNLQGAISKLGDFIQQVTNFIKTGKLTAKQGQPLIDAAQALIAELQASTARSAPSLQTTGDSGHDINASRTPTLRLLPSTCDRASGRITLRFDLPHTSDVSLKFYDVAGRAIHEAVLGTLDAGQHEWSWMPHNNGSALLLYRLQAGELVATGKIVSVR